MGAPAMRIGEFLQTVETTLDTVRHYESLALLQPARINRQKEYGQAEVQAFQVIKELQQAGLSLEDIRLLFNLKQAHGCGSAELIDGAVEQLDSQLRRVEEELLRLEKRRQSLWDTLVALRGEAGK